MKKNISINELRDIIGKSVRKVLMEGYGKSVNYKILSDDFSNLVGSLRRYADELEGFVKEYPRFINEMEKATRGLGLVLTNASTTDYFNLDDISNGADFEFEYSIPNINYQSLSDEQYEELDGRLDEMQDELEIELNNKNFKYGIIEISRHITGFDISYKFTFWD